MIGKLTIDVKGKSASITLYTDGTFSVDAHSLKLKENLTEMFEGELEDYNTRLYHVGESYGTSLLYRLAKEYNGQVQLGEPMPELAEGEIE